MPAVELCDITKSFGSVPAVNGLTLTIAEGETVAFLGPNGAGKSTTISLLLGLLRPDRGTVRLFGQPAEVAVAAGRVGAMLQEGGLMTGVTVAELLSMLAAQYRRPLPVADVIATAQLDGLARRRTDRLSGGQAQRLRVAVALIGNPDLLVLDEPTSAMDVEARRRFWRAIGEGGRTVVFSTHRLEEADAFASRVVVLGMGKVVADGSPAAVKASIGSKRVSFVLPRVGQGDPAAVSRLPGVTSAEVRRARVVLRSAHAEATVRAAFDHWPDLSDLSVGGVGLEDAFLSLTTGGTNHG